MVLNEGFRFGSRLTSGVLLSIQLGFFVFFFRDPPRVPDQEGGIPSPADGYVADIITAWDRVTVFFEMHIKNVHVQRAPLAGRVTKVERIKGKHHKVYFFKNKHQITRDSKPIKKNSRAIIELETPTPGASESNRKMRITQISGKFARRCKPYVEPGDYVAKGSRVGIILFGSLVKFEIEGTDLRPLVQVGDRVKAGETIILTHDRRPE